MTTAETKNLEQAHAQLETLWHGVSCKLHSVQASTPEAQQALHRDILDRMDFIQENYKVSNRTINHVLHLAETHTHFKHYFRNIFAVSEIVINPTIDITKLVTIN